MTEPLKPKSYGKKEIMQRWDDLPDEMPIAFTPIGRKHKGSTFAQCTVRITGPQEFIDSILSNLKGVKDHENESSRLNVKYSETLDSRRDKETGKIVTHGLTGAWGCYITVHDRGRGVGKRGKGKKNAVNGEPLSDDLIPSDAQDGETFQESKPVKKQKEQPGYKAVNAGLELRDRLRAQAAVKAKNTPVGSKKDPLFAIGTKDDEEECGYAWTEPEDGLMPMTTYEDFSSCDSECTKLGKTPAFKKVDLQIVEVWKDSKGKLHCNE